MRLSYVARALLCSALVLRSRAHLSTALLKRLSHLGSSPAYYEIGQLSESDKSGPCRRPRDHLERAIWSKRLSRFALSNDDTSVLPTVPPTECLKKVSAVLNAYVLPGSGTVMLFTAIDRLFAVLFPIKYTGMGARYALGLMLTAYACSTPTFLYCIINSFFGFPPGTLVRCRHVVVCSGMGSTKARSMQPPFYCRTKKVQRAQYFPRSPKKLKFFN